VLDTSILVLLARRREIFANFSHGTADTDLQFYVKPFYRALCGVSEGERERERDKEKEKKGENMP